MLVAVIADTHLPRGNRRLPRRCIDTIARADLLIHAGDFVTAPVLRQLRALGPPVRAVAGNVDDAVLRRTLPAELVVELDGHRVAVVHDGGPRHGRIERLRARFPDCEAAIFAHSHVPDDIVGADGFRAFNPGSPTERRRAESRSMGVLRVTAERLRFGHLPLP
jgi:putative phosphoesterase